MVFGCKVNTFLSYYKEKRRKMEMENYQSSESQQIYLIGRVVTIIAGGNGKWIIAKGE